MLFTTYLCNKGVRLCIGCSFGKFIMKRKRRHFQADGFDNGSCVVIEVILVVDRRSYLNLGHCR